MQDLTKRTGQDLSGWQGRQRERSQQNIEVVCCWVFRWGWTTTQIVSRILDLKRPNLADEFVKRGLLEKIEVPPGCRERFAYILTQPGLDVAQRALDEFHGYIQIAPYTLHESRRIPWTTLHTHNMVGQHILLDLLGPRPDQISYATEPEYRHDGAGEGDEGVPDFSWTDGEVTNLGEIELNHKADLRLKRWIYLRIKHLKQHPETRATIFTPLNAVSAAVQKILNQRQVFEVVKGDQSGKLHERQDRPGIELTPELRQRIEVRMLIKDLSRRTGGMSVES